MIDEGALAVCRNSGADNLTTIDIAYALVAQTDTENRNSASKVADNIIRDSRLKRGTGPRRDDNVGWAQILDFRWGYLVIAIDCRFLAQLTQVLG